MTSGGAPCFIVSDSWNGSIFWDHSHKMHFITSILRDLIVLLDLANKSITVLTASHLSLCEQTTRLTLIKLLPKKFSSVLLVANLQWSEM